jgi:hypothetical protein
LVDETAAKYDGMKRLSDAQLDAIADEWRTKPVAEVGRHVMPLLHHAVACEDEISTLSTRLAAVESALASEREAKDRAERERDAAILGLHAVHSVGFDSRLAADAESKAAKWLASALASRYDAPGRVGRILAAAREGPIPPPGGVT